MGECHEIVNSALMQIATEQSACLQRLEMLDENARCNQQLGGWLGHDEFCNNMKLRNATVKKLFPRVVHLQVSVGWVHAGG